MTTQKQLDQANDHLKKETNLVKPMVELKAEKHGWVEVEHGETEDQDYVWHFSDHHAQRTIPEDQQKCIQIIATYLSKVIPEDIEVTCLPSPDGWEKKVISVKAHGMAKKWNFDEEEMTRYLPKICELISEEIEQNVKRRKFL